MKILHIEDDKSIRNFVQDTMKMQKCFSLVEYIGVESAEEGIMEIKKGKVDLILLDLKLSGKMQGFELLKKLTDKSKVIIITASPESVKKELKKKYSKLIIEVLLKPFNLKDLTDKIKEEMVRQLNGYAGIKK